MKHLLFIILLVFLPSMNTLGAERTPNKITLKPSTTSVRHQRPSSVGVDCTYLYGVMSFGFPEHVEWASVDIKNVAGCLVASEVVYTDEPVIEVSLTEGEVNTQNPRWRIGAWPAARVIPAVATCKRASSTPRGLWYKVLPDIWGRVAVLLDAIWATGHAGKEGHLRRPNQYMAYDHKPRGTYGARLHVATGRMAHYVGLSYDI